MTRSYPRYTVSAAVSWAGHGLHGGQAVKVTVHPGSDGLAFRVGHQRTPATPENVTDTRRCTTLGDISTIEHLMSALAGLDYTDAEIEVEGGELPALDGSATEYVDGLLNAGRASVGTLEVEGLFKRVFTGEDEVKVAIAAGDGEWCYEYDCSPRWPGQQVVTYQVTPEVYQAEIAAARTFAFEEEVEPMRALGLGMGLDENSCLVLGAAGFVNGARFPDEPARHKLLDLIGDLALAGVPVAALDVSAHRSGHRVNVVAAQRLAASVTIRRNA